ncbi:Uncharacterised protein [Serratia plymuthica]|uniref:Uncharacterized protein n=1 Tax=Serratia plymuthica TaxID=82996 RepID=A0A2X4UQQ2_SERPL|nr:Uncharacterised protein [Serratia plymuthica]
MEKHYVLDIQHAGKAFARMQMFTPWAADQLQQALACFPPSRATNCTSVRSKSGGSFIRAAQAVLPC